MKATSIFGGVQVYNIIIQIIRSKFIAVLLGPTGMGISGLLTATTGLISNLTNFGLGTSAVKDISAAYVSENKERIAVIVKVFRNLVWITGLLGLVLCIILSPWLSQLTFGNEEYTIAFIWLSATLLFSQLTSGQMVLLQGMRKLQYLAKANIAGSFFGLVLTIPLYYILGIKGIVPALIIISVISLLLAWFFAKKVEIQAIKISSQQTFAEGKNMLVMGFMISLSGLITIGSSYILRIFISKYGGIEQVGLYGAGFAIITTYVGLIFNSMSTDYYPRLSAVANDNAKSIQTINQQTEIAILIISPIVIVFLVFINWVVLLLYSTKFIAVNEMIHWAALGMLFRATSWAIAFIFLAKGASKTFFWNELLANIYTLGLNLLGYYFLGLEGVGISFLLSYIFYSIQVFIIAKKLYMFRFNKDSKVIFVKQIILAIIAFLSIRLFNSFSAHFFGAILIGVSLWYSYKELDKRLDIKSIFISVRKRF